MSTCPELIQNLSVGAWRDTTGTDALAFHAFHPGSNPPTPHRILYNHHQAWPQKLLIQTRLEEEIGLDQDFRPRESEGGEARVCLSVCLSLSLRSRSPPPWLSAPCLELSTHIGPVWKVLPPTTEHCRPPFCLLGMRNGPQKQEATGDPYQLGV